jgi:hypothetical protein
MQNLRTKGKKIEMFKRIKEDVINLVTILVKAEKGTEILDSLITPGNLGSEKSLKLDIMTPKSNLLDRIEEQLELSDDSNVNVSPLIQEG